MECEVYVLLTLRCTAELISRLYSGTAGLVSRLYSGTAYMCLFHNKASVSATHSILCGMKTQKKNKQILCDYHQNINKIPKCLDMARIKGLFSDFLEK
jgi:hypothetical protein